ncbi:hypothetical protein [Algibacter sp. 2305UL17-15]|uniref:hypothetical protein n=1 Tax=Algibacter sp. 2305UL17-15 TaxID=3231268 RepID=UPI00345A39A6
MKNLLYLTFLLPVLCFSQVGMGTTNPDAALDVRSSNQATPANTDGVLIPKMDEFPAINPTVAQDGMLVYITGLGVNPTSPTKGFYYWDNSSTWIPVAQRINDLLDGKSDFDGTNDGSSIYLGIDAGLVDDGSDNRNIGIGYQSLILNTDGSNNTVLGYRSLVGNVSGTNNTAIGTAALQNNTSNNNTAIGNASLLENLGGFGNVGVGHIALRDNTWGWRNVAIGEFCLTLNTIGNSNIAIGFKSLSNNLDGDDSIAIGYESGESLGDEIVGAAIDEFRNIYIGTRAGNADVDASRNVYIGYEAGRGTYDPITNTGTAENKSGNVFIGYQAGLQESGSDKLYIENSNGTVPLIYGDFANNRVGISKVATTYALEVTGTTEATQYKLSALNTAPASAGAAGVAGEIRVTATHIYVCTAANTWVRAALATW